MKRAEILEQKGYHFLWVDNGSGPELWMWDVSEEIEDQREIASEAFGDVLVAGYGFGLVQKFLIESPKVRSVTTVESVPDVVDEALRTFGKIYGEVVIGDFYSYRTENRYDCVIGDIWIDQALRNMEEYLKFKKKAQSLLKDGGEILGWGKDYFEYLLEKKTNGH